MATTVGQAVSRIRNIIKAVKTDAFITDRFLYSLILKYSNMYMKQEMDKGKYMALMTLYKTLPCVELIEVDKVSACCDVLSGCTIMRTKEKIPTVVTGSYGPLIRLVSSIDGSTDAAITTPHTYEVMQHSSGWKYNNQKYFFLLDGYMYFPDSNWPQAKIDAVFEGNVASMQCDDKCQTVQDSSAAVMDYLYALIEQGVLKDLGMSVQVPTDTATADKQSLQKP
jgi:hypothetical protein